jgi:hypothetical protein
MAFAWSTIVTAASVPEREASFWRYLQVIEWR